MSNERGRPRKYLTVEAFERWVNNDFSHLIKRVNFQDIKMNFVLGFLALILTLLATILVVGVI